MKLYFGPGTCSLSPHIIMREAGLNFEGIKVNIRTHKLPDGGDFYQINPKGYVPVLELDSGQRLTEGAVVVQYLADLKPEANLLPPQGSFERYRALEWLNFIATELHKGHNPLFHKELGEPAVEAAFKKVNDAYTYVSEQLGSKDYLLGSQFTVADAYLFTILTWASFVKIDLPKWPNLAAYKARVAARPSVIATLEAEKR